MYFAGGCFWGLEKYLSVIKGVVGTEAGYANGNSDNPSYQTIGQQGFAETVKVEYDDQVITLDFLLDLFYQAIDPTSYHRQGNDRGVQYRSGIYYENSDDQAIIMESLVRLEKKIKQNIVIEVLPLKNYFPAEEYHQDYLDKNPSGYCHITKQEIENAQKAIVDPYRYKAKTQEELREKLDLLEFEVTQNNATEPPFKNKFDKNYSPGIYVDVTSGEPMFLSNDKFDSGCGWPAFSKPIDDYVINEKEDSTLGMKRTEVRSRVADAHLGHVFEDGPRELGGKRFCINSAALRFIPLEEMAEFGYGRFIPLVQPK